MRSKGIVDGTGKLQTYKGWETCRRHGDTAARRHLPVKLTAALTCEAYGRQDEIMNKGSMVSKPYKKRKTSNQMNW